MNWGKMICVVGLLGVFFSIHVDATPLLQQEAAQHYEEKEYGQARQLYQQLDQIYPNHPAILYNMGNAAFKQGHLGHAIAYYKSARRLSPRDEDIRFNLNKAQSSVIDTTQGDDPFLAALFFYVLDALSVNEWYLFLLSMLTAFCMSLYRVYRGPWRHQFGTVLLAFLLPFSILFCFFFSRLHRDYLSDQAIAIQKKVAVKAGPSMALPTLFFVHEGVVFQIKSNQASWSEIQLRNGFKGWVHASDYQRLGIH